MEYTNRTRVSSPLRRTPALTAGWTYARALLFAMLLVTVPALTRAADASPCQSEQAIADAKDFKEPPSLCISSVGAEDVPVQDRLALAPAASEQKQGEAPAQGCPTLRMPTDRRTLSGSGLVVVGLTSISYQNLRGYEAAIGKRAAPVVSGVDLGASADLVATRVFAGCAETHRAHG